MTWIAVTPGLTAMTIDGASAFSYPLIFLPFVSSLSDGSWLAANHAGCWSLLQPPPRLCATTSRKIARRAGRLIGSPSRMLIWRPGRA
jgi:hypothetical protein